MSDEAVYRTAPATPGLLNIQNLGVHLIPHTDGQTLWLKDWIGLGANSVKIHAPKLIQSISCNVHETIVCSSAPPTRVHGEAIQAIITSWEMYTIVYVVFLEPCLPYAGFFFTYSYAHYCSYATLVGYEAIMGDMLYQLLCQDILGKFWPVWKTSWNHFTFWSSSAHNLQKISVPGNWYNIAPT